MVTRFELSLSDELLNELVWQESEVPSRVRETLVMDLLRLDRVSEAQAAELLGLDRWALLEVMGRYEVPAIRLKPDDIKQDLFRAIKEDS